MAKRKVIRSGAEICRRLIRNALKPRFQVKTVIDIHEDCLKGRDRDDEARIARLSFGFVAATEGRGGIIKELLPIPRIATKALARIEAIARRNAWKGLARTVGDVWEAKDPSALEFAADLLRDALPIE